jgi:hypothetical protein
MLVSIGYVHTCTHTHFSKSRMKISLVTPDGCFPAQRTACLSSNMVNEKALQGGGLVPLATEEDHISENKESHSYLQSCLPLAAYDYACNNTSLTQIIGERAARAQCLAPSISGFSIRTYI